MSKYLPSKKFILIILSIILAVGTIFLFSWLGENKKTTILVDSETNTKIQEFIELDSDGDGMKDWEESLWKTDPQKMDTDNDGTNDGDEINLNRDPLKANTAPTQTEPNDKVSEEIIAENKKIQTEYENLSETDKLARQIFSQFIANKQLDISLTDTQIESIVANSLINLELPIPTFKTYNEQNVQTINFSDNETLKNYSNNIAEVILTNLNTKTETVESIFNDISNITDDTKLTEQTEEILQRLNPLIIKNQKTVSSLLKIFVPKILLTEHLKLLNSFQEIYQGLDLIQKSTTDFVTIIPLINQYDSSVNNLSVTLTEMAIKLSTLSITYSNTTDYGYQFFNVIMFKE